MVGKQSKTALENTKIGHILHVCLEKHPKILLLRFGNGNITMVPHLKQNFLLRIPSHRYHVTFFLTTPVKSTINITEKM